ncbi:hypothetical protein IW261DRAFT_1590741 [Armillaria novae-zelandiae]|uniref:Uncharacterized protein n=1 Tax=Armillaria novae-zelandiae TaxID=153914 RepID=A0AA39PLE0_9AGAR|nr:hypothetical protein IW261DRAFT_1590741 [Armillaria novae-zelandiae]
MIPSPASSATLVSPGSCHPQNLNYSVTVKPKGHLELHMSNLPRRRVTKRKVITEESKSSNEGSAKTYPARSPRVVEESQRQYTRIQALGEGTDVYVSESLVDVQDWDWVVIRVEDEGETDRGVPTLSQSDFFVAASGKVLVVGRVNAFAVALRLICRRNCRDVIKTV